MYVQYDPTKHKDLPLFEEQTKSVDGGVVFVTVPSKASHAIAALTPWYYFIELDAEKVKSTIDAGSATRLTLKGSPTSGWYSPPKGTHSGEKHREVGSGKAGKPPSKGKVTITRWGIHPEVDNALFGMDISREQVAAAFAVPDLDVELHTLGRKIGNDYSATLVGELKDPKTGAEVGNVHCIMESHGGIKAWHWSLVSLKSGHQNKGVVRGLMAKQIAFAKSIGCTKGTLNADITIGRYAWAKSGFDYARPGRLEKATKGLHYWAAHMDISLPGLPKFKSAYEIATYDMGKKFTPSQLYGFRNPDVPLDMRMTVGKAYMLDKSSEGHGSWDGVLDLS